MPSPTGDEPIVLAYSGGLDTSFLVPWLSENYGRPIITVTVDTGGIDAGAARSARGARARARRHRAPSGRRARRLLRAGAALPDHGQRAARPALSAVRGRRARHAGADHRAHGAQARHQHRSRTAAPPPATTRCASKWRCARSRRSSKCSRRCATRRSSARRSSTTCRSATCRCRRSARRTPINRGLWGVTIGGKETLTSAGSIPDHAWVLSKDAFTNPRAPRAHTHRLRAGPCRSGSTARRSSPSQLIEQLEDARRAFGIGRGIHLGDTIIGTKGRVAFEAPAAEMLLTAHRELEKLVLTAAPAAHQGTGRAALRRPGARRPAAGSGVPRHRGAASRPRRSASPARCTCCSGPAVCSSRASSRRYSLMAASKGVYGEAAGEWTAADALGFLEDRRAARHVPRRARRAATKDGCRWQMRHETVVVDKIASVTQACGLAHEVRVATDDIPAEEGVVVVVEVLNNKSTYNTLELTSGRMAKVGQGRHRRRRARPSQGAVRLLGPRARAREARRHHPDAQHRRRARHLRLGQSRQGQAVRLPRASACVLHFPYLGERIGVPARVGYAAPRLRRDSSTRAACRSSRSPAPAWKPARPPPPARSSARMRHRGLRGRCVQGDRRLAAPRHPRDGGRRRAPHR